MRKLISLSVLFIILLPSCNIGPENNDISSKPSQDPASLNAVLSTNLHDVSHWLYLIDVDLEEETIAQIEASSYDMVVIDFITSEEWNTDFPLAEVIARWHDAPHPKLVIAYIDIGEAESYRTYWQEGWKIDDPEWIVSADPDGWEENYPVAFWHDEYRNIWLGEDGYLAQIIAAGFDGVYLDWVEAYSDEAVLQAASQDGVDARQEMIWWVTDIAEFSRSIEPGFLVIAQNAAELTESHEYLAVIDAIAQEQVWFDGGADNIPPGDCPLPATDADIDSPEYINNLSRVCRQQYEQYPESTLHISSAEYLEMLLFAQDQGLTIFTVDYALQPENIAYVYQLSREYGFIPFVSNRALDQFLPPFP